MQLTLRTILSCTVFAFLFSACTSTKHIAYFQDISDSIAQKAVPITTAPVTPTIQPDDILMIMVSGSNPAAAAVYNQGSTTLSSQVYIGETTTTESLYGRTADTRLGYLVDQHGDINFPVLGTIHVADLTLQAAQDTIAGRLFNSLSNPLVNIRFLNYKITVLGEVARPGTYTIPNQEVTLLQALGLAGDLTIFAKRANIMVIREKNGQRQYGRINLNDSKDLFNSPFYYLQQNDVVYVEPRKSKVYNTDQATLRNVSILVTILSALSVIATRF